MSIFQPSTPGLENLPLVEGQEVNEPAEEMEETYEEPVETDNSDEYEEEQPEEETPSEEETSELLAGKFKSPQDLAEAYKNLQREFSRKTSELSQYKRQTQPQEEYSQDNNQDPREIFWNAFQNDPLGTMNYFIENAVQQRTAPIYEERANEQLSRNFETVAKDYPQIQTEEGIQAFGQKLQELAQEYGNPQLAQQPTARIMREAARELYGDKSADLYKKAVAKGKQEALNNLRTKQGLSAPTGTKPKEQPKSMEDQIADSIVSAGRRNGIFG